MTIADIKSGHRALIIEGELLASSKLIDLGIKPNAEIKIVNKVPFKGLIGIKIVENNSLIAIRVQDAKQISIEQL